MLDAADGIGDLDGVANAVLVFQDDVEAGDDVANQILRAKPDRQAGESGDGGDRSDVQAELLRGGEQRKGPNDFAGAAVNNCRERAGLLFACLSGFTLRGGWFDDELGNEFQKAVDEQSAANDDEQMQKIRNGKRRNSG